MTEFKRIFVAVPIIPNSNFISLLNKLKKEFVLDKVTWTRIENIHFTLCFIGETAEYLLPHIKEQLNIACANMASANISLNGLGCFGHSYQPKVLWLGIKPQIIFQDFYFDIHKKLSEIGVKTVMQNYVPHITLGRIYSLHNKKHFHAIVNEYSEINVQNIKVDNIYLYESILSKKEPPLYKEIASIELKSL